MEYCKYIVFERMNSLTILRPEKYGGNVTFISYDELENAFVDGNVHPADLKTATARAINELLIPVRDYFENNAKAKKLKLLVESYDVTR